MAQNEVTPPPFNVRLASEQINLKQLLDEVARGIMLRLNAHAIGQIVSFDPVKQKAQVRVVYVKTFARIDSKGERSITHKEYPILSDAPVIFMGGGTANLTMPVSPGDTCVLLFNDRDIDNFITSGQITPVNSNRLHDLNDAMVLVGVRPFTNPIQNFDTARAVLRNKNAQVGVGQDKIKLANQITNLHAILSDLISALKTTPLIASTGAVGTPSPLNPAIASLLDDVQDNIDALLE